MKSTCIGVLRNNWRGRLVHVYETDDPAIVRTVGWPLNTRTGQLIEGAKTIECFEDRKSWERTISLYPKTAVYD